MSNQKLIHDIEKILLNHTGLEEVYICTEQPKKMFKWNDMRININQGIKEELETLLGKENIKIII